ncbi:GST N-terminal domain-containing protein [Mycena indigotica]|uniref:GST N-terminal domain-containing protein n=1 Tax=Mycena indigotica TaxID=2126181 RepID=A0A8H6W5L4_9AGAR|nr:GST N-terminal domain-containing protein [Mycena indigotica]KAF7306659.1 GST N-terminal domain-containing protein [Mycena indigotica]
MTKILYVFAGSVWAAAAELAIAELGYTEPNLIVKTVNLIEGENFSPDFIKKNPNATLPTLEEDGKFYTTTADVIAVLVKDAPNKVKAGTSIVQTIHDDKYDPNFAMLLTRNEEELAIKSKGLAGLFLGNRQKALEKYLQDPAAAPYKTFLEGKKAFNGGKLFNFLSKHYLLTWTQGLLAVVNGTASAEHKAGFFAQSQAHFASVKTGLYEVVPGLLPESGFIGGEIPGEDDFHVGAWLTRIAATTGATSADNGVESLGKAYGGPVPAKVAAYWAAWTARPSWKKVYASSLH